MSTTRRHWRPARRGCRSWCARRGCRRRCGPGCSSRTHRLGANLRVAVRSSATAEDAADVSFAGMNQTFTNVRGDDDLCRARRRLLGVVVRATRGRRTAAPSNITDEPAIAVIVQQMVESERSGVMFTVDPSTGDRSVIVIEGAFGLGEVVVGGQVEPDTYRVAKDGPRVTDVRTGVQSFCIRPDADGGDRRVELTPDEGGRRVLDDDEVARARAARSPGREPLRQAPRHRMGDRRSTTSSWSSRVRSPRWDSAQPAAPGASDDDALVRGLGASPGPRRRPGAGHPLAFGR